MRFCALVLALVFTVGGQEIDWARLQLESNVFTTMQYGNLKVEVYEQLKSPNVTQRQPWYYFAPINLFLPQSTECNFNTNTKENELVFSVVFWNDDLHQRIVDHLKDTENIRNAKVDVIPIENVILTITKPSTIFRPTHSWVSYRRQKSMTFKLTYDSERECQDAKKRARSNPQDFDHLGLAFNAATRTRIAKISIDSIRQGSLFSKLDQKFPNADSVLLTADNTNRLLSESTTRAIVQIFDDSEKPNPSSEARIYDILEEMLLDSKETIKEQSSKQWSSVYYRNENYRPDHVTQAISDIYRRSDKEGQIMISSLFSNSTSSNIDAALELAKYRLSSNANSEAESFSKSGRTSDTFSNSRSDSSSRRKQSQSHNKDEKRNNSDTSVNYGAGGFGFGFSDERNEDSSSRGMSESQEKALEEIKSLSRQRDRSDVSNDQLAEKLARASAKSEEEEKKFHEIFKLLLEGKERVEWQGSKFQPKPLTLSRINLAKVRARDSIGSSDVKLTYSKATLTSSINIDSSTSQEPIYWLAEMQKNQSDAFKKMYETQTRLNQEMIYNNRDLQAAVANSETAFKQKLAETQKTCERNLREAWVDVRNKLNTLERITNHLKTEMDRNSQECPENIGVNSTCKEFRRMGCYCIVEILKNFDDAADYCAEKDMKVVAIETEEEQKLLRRFLADNLGSRGKYAQDFKTSGVRVNSVGQWQWTSSKRPLIFRNWGSYYPGFLKNRLVISKENPFTWFNQEMSDEKGFYSAYFICESSASQQEIKHLTAYVNAKDCPQSIGINSTCVYLDPHGCYCVVLTESNWLEGYTHCKSEGMALVSIESEAEYSQIVAFLREHQSSYTRNFFTSAMYSSNDDQWTWTATDQSMTYANWAAGETRCKEREGMCNLNLGMETHEMRAALVNSPDEDYRAHYICEKSTNSFVNGPRNNQMEKKSCSAGSGWTCRNQMTGCYCYQTIERNWADASAQCKSIGMNLVSIQTPAKEFDVASGLPKISDRILAGWWTGVSGVHVYSGGPNLASRVERKAQAMMISDSQKSPYLADSMVTDKYYPLCEK